MNFVYDLLQTEKEVKVIKFMINNINISIHVFRLFIIFIKYSYLEFSCPIFSLKINLWFKSEKLSMTLKFDLLFNKPYHYTCIGNQDNRMVKLIASFFDAILGQCKTHSKKHSISYNVSTLNFVKTIPGIN